eukprot:5506459-Amphidinium_carterae.1
MVWMTRCKFCCECKRQPKDLNPGPLENHTTRPNTHAFKWFSGRFCCKPIYKNFIAEGETRRESHIQGAKPSDVAPGNEGLCLYLVQQQQQQQQQQPQVHRRHPLRTHQQ